MHEYDSVEWSGSWDDFTQLIEERNAKHWDYIGPITVTDDGPGVTRLAFRRPTMEEARRFTGG